MARRASKGLPGKVGALSLLSLELPLTACLKASNGGWSDAVYSGEPRPNGLPQGEIKYLK